MMSQSLRPLVVCLFLIFACVGAMELKTWRLQSSAKVSAKLAGLFLISRDTGFCRWFRDFVTRI